MAIPFIPQYDDSDYEEALLQQLFADLWHTLQQIELIQRSRRAQHASSPRGLTTASASTSRRQREEPGDPAEPERRLPDSLVNLALSLSPAGSQNELDAILQPQNLCEETTKPVRVSVSVEVTNKDWAQQEKSAQSSSDKRWSGSESLLSKLVPAPFSGPLWTAVICVVGWHLLRAR